MSATCEKCQGTGQLPGSAYLDCTHCDTAIIRVGLETWATENGIVADKDELLAIFKYGQSVALENAKKDAIAADLDARNDVTEACGLGSNRQRSFTWGFLLNYIRAAIDEAE